MCIQTYYMKMIDIILNVRLACSKRILQRTLHSLLHSSTVALVITIILCNVIKQDQPTAKTSGQTISTKELIFEILREIKRSNDIYEFDTKKNHNVGECNANNF